MPNVIAIETALMVAVPVILGIGVLGLAPTVPSLRRPARTCLILFVALVVATALLSPGGDLVTPAIGGIVSAVVCVVVFVKLRRRRAPSRV